MGCQVRDVAGDVSKGRIQDSRRGGDIPAATRDCMLVVRTCIEDAVLDPLMDMLYLCYNTIYGKIDLTIGKKCAEFNKLTDEELMKICGITPFFVYVMSDCWFSLDRAKPKHRLYCLFGFFFGGTSKNSGKGRSIILQDRDQSGRTERVIVGLIRGKTCILLLEIALK